VLTSRAEYTRRKVTLLQLLILRIFVQDLYTLSTSLKKSPNYANCRGRRPRRPVPSTRGVKLHYCNYKYKEYLYRIYTLYLHLWKNLPIMQTVGDGVPDVPRRVYEAEGYIFAIVNPFSWSVLNYLYLWKKFSNYAICRGRRPRRPAPSIRGVKLNFYNCYFFLRYVLNLLALSTSSKINSFTKEAFIRKGLYYSGYREIATFFAWRYPIIFSEHYVYLILWWTGRRPYRPHTETLSRI